MLTQILLNKLLSKLSLTFKIITFNKSKLSTDILILDIRDKHLESQNNNLFNLYKNKFDYILVYFFVNSKTIKCNVDKLLNNFLIQSNTKNILYINTNMKMKKFFDISLEI